MKKWVFASVLGLLILLFSNTSTNAAETAEWGLCGFYGNIASVGYIININSLQVDRFVGRNNSGQPLYMDIQEDGETIFEFTVQPYSPYVEQEINGFKFRRIPATDHDDPNSIRYPRGVSMSCRWSTS